MKGFAVLSIFLLITFLLADDIWSPCGDASQDLLQIQNVVIKPIPLVKGKPVYAAMQGQLTDDVTGGKAEVKVKYGFVTVYHDVVDICNNPNTTIKCPMVAGNVFLSTPPDQILPTYVPGGTYSGYVKITDDKNRQITCINFKVKIEGDKVPEQLNEMDLPVNDQNTINQLNNMKAKTHWVAGKNKIFENMSVSQAKRRFLGTRNIKLLAKQTKSARNDIPDSFDWREKSKCVHPIRDQGHCGSCWAFGATEAVSDRFCISSQGSVDVVLSPQYLVDCDSGDMGCNGGFLGNAWDFMKGGVPSEECYPYTSSGGEEGDCKRVCKDGSPMKLHKITNVRDVVGPGQIAEEVMKNGPIEVAFTVYRDFMNYKSGVYSHKSGGFLGGHAIKLVGWGKTTDGTPYWICANSWTANWGIDGFFWILKGSDECGIESNGVAGDPIL